MHANPSVSLLGNEGGRNQCVYWEWKAALQLFYVKPASQLMGGSRKATYGPKDGITNLLEESEVRV